MEKEILRNKVLETLSFFDPMTKEHLIRDFDTIWLEAHPQFTDVELTETLNILLKDNYIKKIFKNDEVSYLKMNLSKRTIWQKLLIKINHFFNI